MKIDIKELKSDEKKELLGGTIYIANNGGDFDLLIAKKENIQELLALYPKPLFLKEVRGAVRMSISKTKINTTLLLLSYELR